MNPPAQKKWSHRRRVPRRAFNRNVGVLARGRYFITNCRQIGEGGAMIESADPLHKDQMVVLVFRIPGSMPSVCRGTVRYKISKKNDHEIDKYGVEFENLSFESKRAIRHYVASKSEQEFLEAALN